MSESQNIRSADELAKGDEMFYALQANGINGDVASWLVDLALRVKRLEGKEDEMARCVNMQRLREAAAMLSARDLGILIGFAKRVQNKERPE